jgi:TonB family protein
MAFLGPSLRRKRVTERPAARIALAALASLALNALLILTVARLGAFELARPSPTERVVLAPLNADQWSANRAIASGPRPPPQQAQPAVPAPLPAPAQQPPAPPPPPPEERQPSGQVVDVAPSKDSRAPEKSRFLSERDNRVEKETKSRWAGTKLYEKRAAAPVEGEKAPAVARRGEGGTAAESRPEKAGQGGTGGREARPSQQKEASPSKPASTDDRLAMLEPAPQPGLLGSQERPQPPAAGEESMGKPGAPGERQEAQRKAGDANLLPSVASMSRIAAGPSNDFIDDANVEEGEATVLNTRAFKFAGFWNRFKQDVSAHWRPAMVYNERDPHGNMFGNQRERATGLHVVLDASGAVKDIRVVEQSGLDFLDREAVRAVRAASPFYNVPQGLVDQHGEVAFSFGMVLMMDRAVPVRPVYNPRAAE